MDCSWLGSGLRLERGQESVLSNEKSKQFCHTSMNARTTDFHTYISYYDIEITIHILS